MQQIATEVAIDARRSRVWAVLTDLAAYPEWNPFIREISGSLEEGARLRVRLEPPGQRAITVRPRVVRLEPERELRWLGQILVPGIFDGLHAFRILPGDDGGARLIHGEVFRGALVPLLWRRIAGPTERGFTAMNAALKQRAEQTPTG